MNRETLFVRLWGLRNVFMLWFCRPVVLEVNERRCEVRIPLNWRTKNHMKSMYFGALCVGADIAGGLIAFHLAQQRKGGIAFLFKDFKAEFHKRAEGDTHFSNEDGPAIAAMVERAFATGERQEALVHVTATVPKISSEPVARFEMTLSIKKR